MPSKQNSPSLGNLRRSSEVALASALQRIIPDLAWREDYPQHLVHPEDNLLPGLLLDSVAEEFRRGAGNELIQKNGRPPKFCAAFSSSALAVNCFAPFKKHSNDLTLFGVQGFGSVQFEAQCPSGLGGTPPHLDILCTGPQRVLAIESKCTEYLTDKAAEFRPSYRERALHLFETSWREVFERLVREPLVFSPLDAAQLVKHYLGLRNTFSDREITLAYLYWEPDDASEFDHFVRHSDSISRFTKAVAASEVYFVAASYSSIWNNWMQRNSPSWLKSHATALRARYDVGISALV